MNFDDYAHHIYQKHRLAIALGILKSKPDNVDTSTYLEELKSKVQDKMDVDDVTVCSDDFLFDNDEMNDSVTILKDFDIDGHENGVEIGVEENVFSEKLATQDNLSQTTFYESSPTQFSPYIDQSLNKITICEENLNVNQLKDFKKAIPRTTHSNNEKSSFNIDQTSKEKHNKPYEEGNKDTNLGANAANLQFNIDYNDSNVIDNKSANPNTAKNDYIDVASTINSKANEIGNKVTNPKANAPNSSIRLRTNEDLDQTYYDSQKTVFYTVHGYTQNYTHYSASQSDVIIPERYIYGRKDTNNITEVSNDRNNEQINITNVNTQNVNEFENITELNEGNSLTNKIYEKTNEQLNYSQTMKMFSEQNDNNFAEIQNNDHKISNMDSYNNKNENIQQPSQNINKYFDEMQNIDEDNTIIEGNTQNFHLTDLEMTANIENNENRLFITRNQSKELPSEEDNTEEIVSYKVLEEFNKIKTFLNRQTRRMSCDGYSTDSGYRSDSQRSKNRSALQLSGNWLNQSGTSLFNYIMQTPLVVGTRDITNEIAQVFGQLIDTLHDEEKYPSFLEELLETVDLLLQQVYEGESSGDSEFLKKDEYIQRLLLLNKSIHTQQHTIEKITKILETFHSKVTEENSVFELTNVDEMENITYIFHLLEILLKKYLKNKELLSQSQLSQDEEKILKKSSITDIWRKKWNPSQKVFEGSREKKCVLKSCSDVLNKIVVECVNCYSLVAYSALKCFNSMQN